ncbi:hypothetical protein HPB50_022577 [Hyalomma asiaticum]|uniref:Uncharacterized protein n=1 Tax=Hyalomma asiaticum TaxID=266040 RepID=A0ACB7RVV8_HYAAI|nr:hypothetical protein HPB50_022577 [Hyalomma asiaticum]
MPENYAAERAPLFFRPLQFELLGRRRGDKNAARIATAFEIRSRLVKEKRRSLVSEAMRNCRAALCRELLQRVGEDVGADDVRWFPRILRLMMEKPRSIQREPGREKAIIFLLKVVDSLMAAHLHTHERVLVSQA